ncbi:MAG TPA: hypothetical protein VGC55_06790 [Dokdonella sp.]
MTSADGLCMAGGAIALLLVWGIAWFVVPQFAGVYASFGAELPLATRWLLASYRYGFVLPILVAAVWAGWPKPASRGIAALAAGTTIAALLAISALIALYLPIYRLGAGAG